MTTIHHGLGLTGLGGLGSGSADKTPSAQDAAAQSLSPVQQVVGGAQQEVEITPTAQLLATVAQQLAGTPDINQSRVDSIRQALGDGSYRIDSTRVADGLLTAQKIDAQAASGAGSAAQSNTLKVFAATAKLGSDPG